MMDNFRMLRMIATRKSITRIFLLFAIMFVLHNSNAVATPANNEKIWRAQIYIVISDIANAETKDKISVQLNAANNTLLNGDRNYFTRGGTHIWDLRMDGINQFSDLDYLRISKNGSDEMCISLIYLLINNFVIYAGRFSDGLWLNNSEGFSNIYLVDDYFIRQGPDWGYYPSPPIPTIIPVSNTRSRLETLVGDFIYTTALDWGPIYGDHGVDISVVTTNTWRVDLDLSGCSFISYLRGDVDVDFDLTISCANAKPNFLVSNVAISAPNSCGTSLNALLNFITSTLRLRLNEMMKNHVYRADPLYPAVCPRVTLSPTGDLHVIPQGPTRGRAVEEVAAAETYSKAPTDDSGALLAVQIKTTENVKPFTDTPLNIQVKSNLTEDTEADMQIQLPAQIALSDIQIEAQDATGKRKLVAQMAVDQNGNTLLGWRDNLPAGKDVVYTIQVKFLDQNDAELEIQTQVTAVNERSTEQALVPLHATTFFQSQAEGIMIQGTIIDAFPKRLIEKKKLHQQ